MSIKRYALVSLHLGSSKTIASYLPFNYAIGGFAPHDPTSDTDVLHFGPCALVEGRDVAGWTLHGYVIPRLASGLIDAQEIDLSHPVMKHIEEKRP